MKQTVRQAMALATLLMMGCSHDSRLVEFAKQTNEQQAQQNQEMAKLNREVAAGSKHIAEASSQATQRILAMEKDLQVKHHDLESERKELAQERKTDSLLGAFLVTAARLIAASLPLVLSWYLLHSLQKQGDSAVTDLLIEELDRAASGSDLSELTSDSPRHLEV